MIMMIFDLVISLISSITGFLMLIGSLQHYTNDDAVVVALALGLIYMGIRLTKRTLKK